MTSVLHQSQCGGGCLDPFSDHLQAEGVGESDDRADNGQVAGVGAQVTDESGVDLEHVDREGLQMRQHRIAGAEVVDGDLDPDLLQLPQGFASGFDVVYHGTLGDLQTDRSAVDAELLDGVGNAINETTRDQLDG